MWSAHIVILECPLKANSARVVTVLVTSQKNLSIALGRPKDQGLCQRTKTSLVEWLVCGLTTDLWAAIVVGLEMRRFFGSEHAEASH